MRQYIKISLRAACVVVPGLLYLITAPVSVQSLDTGELVGRASGWLLPHAPGYPLYIWLYHFWLSWIPLEPFAAAAMLTVFLSLSSIFLISRLLEANASIASHLLTFGAVSVFATVPIVWRYSILPDVFALNMLFAVAIVTVSQARLNPDRKLAVLAYLFCVGLANHQSLVFLLPMVLVNLSRNSFTRYSILHCHAAAALFLALNLSMQL